MKTIVIGGNRNIRVKDITEPIPTKDEALITVKACGICGSEMPNYYSSEVKETSPGHESAGVVEVPGNSGYLKKGDRVVLCAVSGCGECEYCKQGHENYCSDIWTKGRWFRPPGHSEKIAYVERNCLKIPDSMDFDTAIAVGGCGIGVAWHGIKRFDIHKGEPVAVFGVGPIGLSAVMILKHIGALPIAVDISEYRLDLAMKLGAVEKIKSESVKKNENLVSILKKKKISRSILCTGNHTAANNALLSLVPLGKMLVLGGLSSWPFNSFSLIGVGDKSILGSWHYHRIEWPEIIKLVESGLPVKKMITHIFPFSKAEEAYKLFAEGNTGKVILKPEKE